VYDVSQLESTSDAGGASGGTLLFCMRIRLNGDVHELPAPETVATLLDRLGIDARTVAVELDRIVVKRARYPETPVREGAEVEIVAFVGGG
jgi:thiamine biosynthesis protein ThiS